MFISITCTAGNRR